MPGPWLLALIALAYLGLLFAIAWVGDRWAAAGRQPIPKPWIYSLSLAVYCTSWAFYGTVGQSAGLGWAFPPTYVGTILLFLLIPGLLAKLISVSRRERITSVADFIAARYGRDRSLAVAVTLIAACGIIPYIALQLKAIDLTFGTLTVASGGVTFEDTAVWVAATLALFAILFGTRHVDATEHHPGMMLALAFESIVKLVAFVAVGAFVTWGLFGGFGDIARQVAAVPGLAELRAGQSTASHYLALAVLGFFAIFCLPRQFHVAVVENSGPADLRMARWLFPLYLVAISVFILPIANAGLVLGNGDADLFVLGLPLAAGADGLALFAFIGGLSAATGMVIVASVALSTMLCNEIVMPVLMRLFPAWRERQDLTGVLLTVRRAAIVVLLALGWLYHRWIVGNDALASIGEISFAAVALFGPAMLAGLWWRRASRAGALASLAAGFAAWSWTLLVPTLAQAGLVSPALLADGPAGIALLRPTALFGLELHPLAHGLVWSLGVATLALFAVSPFSRRSLLERVQAASFVDAEVASPQAAPELTARELRPLVERFIGGKRAARHFADLGWRGGEDARASGEQLEATRKLLASVVGASSAQRLVDAAVAGREVPLEDVVTIVGGASQALEFSRELLQSTLENVSQGISVVDAELRLVAWNRRYVEMYGYPPGFLRIGQPIEEVLRFNAARGRLRDGDGPGAIERRLAHLRRGTPYSLQRTNPDGTVLEIRGNPMPGGGFVTSYTDVTEYKRAEEALRVANESLEQRVRERTRALSAMNDELLAAKAEAERANAGKTRFLAAAGHDLMQPLNAAGLFAGALSQRARGDGERALLADLESCLQSAEGLISDLLDISRLDTGVIRAQAEDLPLAPLLDALDAEFRLDAGKRGLAFTVRRTRAVLRSDPKLLRRVLQNFVANALRYTPAGRVLVGVRRRGGRLRIEVWDTGIGIPPEHQARVFEEFYRGGVRREADETRGFGLGLAIAERIARVLGHEIGLRSVPGRGSVFWIEVARGSATAAAAAAPQPARAAGALAGVRVLCIDNDPAALRGLATLLDSWGCETLSAQGIEDLVAGRRLQSWRPDLIVVDYHLEGGATGLEVVRHLRAVEGIAAPVLVVSADAGDAVRQEAEALDCVFLRKPLKPLAVRSALSRLLESAA
ncbi:MAG: hybrid sensor histidine kinase/response regulator [Steroidobacteraceae bacterium]|nr:hybrid sensor histidine kinase/response regulator [Steroidobacteraceae bacterium]